MPCCRSFAVVALFDDQGRFLQNSHYDDTQRQNREGNADLYPMINKTRQGRILYIHYLIFDLIDPIPKSLICPRLMCHMYVVHGDSRTLISRLNNHLNFSNIESILPRIKLFCYSQ